MQGLREFASDIMLFVRETLEFFRDKGHLRVFALLMILVGVTSLCSAGANGSLRDDQWVSDWLQNFSTEMLGAVVTFILFIGYIDSRQRRMAKQAEEDQRRIAREAEEEQEIKRLILQMSSPFNEFAVEAARVLRARNKGWFEEETLQGANLVKANLQKANLDEINLQDAFLIGANLQDTSLEHANLKGADLRHANLQGAYLFDTNMQGVHLYKASLQKAFLKEINLQDVDLLEANLQGAHLEYANLQKARLRSAKLQEAQLESANLQGTNLQGARLQGANLSNAILHGVDLGYANLQGAIFEGKSFGSDSQMDKDIRLPDGSHFDPDKGLGQLERFTNPDFKDPDNPDPQKQSFWRPEPDQDYIWWHKSGEENDDQT